MLIVGSPVSPYVRKILAILHLKGLDYELDPITPFYGNDEFTKLSPLRRIPVLIDDDVVVNDSTVIAEYLDEAYPDVPVLPTGARARAQSRWIEEYGDSRLCDLCIWELFFPKVVAPHVFKRSPDEDALAKATDGDLPEALDWIEERAPGDGFPFGDGVGIADLAIACPLRNAAIAGWTPDPARWPKTTAWLDRIAALPSFARTVAMEPAILATRADGRRAALENAGVRVAGQSFGTDQPRASIMLR